MIPAKGLPFAELDTHQVTNRSASAITLDEWVRLEQERAEDFQTPEPAAVRRLPPMWTLEEPHAETHSETEEGIARGADWDPELDYFRPDPDNPEPAPVDIFGLMTRPAPTALSTLGLSRRYDQAMREVNIRIGDYSLAKRLRAELRKAAPLMGGGPDSLVEADRIIGETELRVQTILQKVDWGKKDGRMMFFYYLAAGLVSGFMAVTLMSVTNPALPLLNTFLTACFLGLLGASVGSLFILRRAVSPRNLLPIKPAIWYFSQPLIGIPLGALIFGLALVFLQVSVPGLDSIENPLVIYFAAFTGGVLMNFIQELFATRRRYRPDLGDALDSDWDQAE